MLLLLPGVASCSGPQCTSYREFLAQLVGVNVTGFQDQGCVVTFSRGGASVAYTVPAQNGGPVDAALPPPAERMLPTTPVAGAPDPACYSWSGDGVACPGANDAPPATCLRSATCLQVKVDDPAADQVVGRLGGTNYHVTVTCGGVLLYQADDDAHREACGA
ncbi:MAG: hypothetical protein ACRENE_09125 [Polyangiaceae bacterium]